MKKGLSVNTDFQSLSQRMRISRGIQCFSTLGSPRDILIFRMLLILGHKIPSFPFFETHFSLRCFLAVFSFKFTDLIMEKTVVFIYISPNRIQQELFIHLFRFQFFPLLIDLHNFVSFCFFSASYLYRHLLGKLQTEQRQGTGTKP